MVQHESDQSGEQNADDRDSGSLARTVRLISGDYLLTVNPVDGSEIERCPPGQRPGAPQRRPAGATCESQSAVERGPRREGQPTILLERDEERERLTRLLGRGRSVRLTGPRGAGRTALLDAVAADAADLAPDGVVRLSGYRRSVTDVLHDLFAAVYDAPDQRPERRRLREALSSVGAVVVLDDAEFGGGTLDELLTATPECAYLIATTPDVAAPTEQSRIEEIFLPGLSRTGSLELLEHLLARPLTDDESDWAGDLWFLSEGRPLTFVQAGALLRQRGGGTALALYGAGTDGWDDSDGGLPSGVDLAADVAAGLSGSARGALRIAVALGGELPKGTHLPALLGEDHADEAPVELADAGLITEAGGHYRLAAAVAGQLAGSEHRPDYADDAASRAETVAEHYAWWVSHPSVSAARVAGEADALVATVQAAQREGRAAAAVLLARAAAPVLAAASRWGAWERILRGGQEAARAAGEVAEQGYFHHELGVLALCQGNPERARAELDASIALRAALADKHGTVAGRRTLALVTDSLAVAANGGEPGVTPGTPNGPTVAGVSTATTEAGLPKRSKDTSLPAFGDAAGAGAGAAAAAATPVTPPVSASPATPATPPLGVSRDTPDETPTSPTPKALYAKPELQDDDAATAAALSRAAAMDDSIAELRAAAQDDRGIAGIGGRRGLALRGTRKNVLAAGAGAVLAAVLGTVVTLTAASDGSDDPSGGPVKPDQTSSLTDDYGVPPEDTPDEAADPEKDPSADPETPGPSSAATPSPTDSPDPRPGAPADDPTSPSDDDNTSSSGGGNNGGSSTSGGTTSGGGNGGGDPTPDPPTTEPTDEPTDTAPPSPDPSPTPTESTDPSSGPTTSGQAGGDTSSPTASGPAPTATESGTSPTGSASGGTGGPVV